MPSSPCSIATARINPSIAPLAAPYAPEPELLTNGPVTDVTFTMRPYFCFFIIRIADFFDRGDSRLHAVLRHPGVVHQDIDRAGPLRDLFHHLLRARFLRQIGNERKHALTGWIELLGCVMNALGSGADGHERTFAEKMAGDGKTDARGTARASDDCRLTLQGRFHPRGELSFDATDTQILDLEKFLDAIFRAFATEARFLHTAEWCNFGGNNPRVDADDSVLERFGNAPDSGKIASVEIRGEAELSVVRQRNRLRFGLEAEKRRDRTKRLRASHSHLRRGI